MAKINETILRDFEREIPRANAHFNNRGFVSVVKVADCEDGDHYAGLIRTREGFFRIALDEANNALILFASKVADNLKGHKDAESGSIRPSDNIIQKTYSIAARRLRSGPLLPPDTAEFFLNSINDYSAEIRKDSSDKFTFYGIRIDKNEIYANKYAAYIIEANPDGTHSVRLVIPAQPQKSDYIPLSTKSRWDHPLQQSYIIKGASRAEAHHLFAIHSQALSSRLWDHKGIYEGQGVAMHAGKFLTDLVHYPAQHGLEMATTALVAGAFTYSHEAKLGLAIATLAASHALADISLKASFTKAHAKFEYWRQSKKHAHLGSYADNEDCVFYYLNKSTENLQKPWHHADAERMNVENLRFLTFAEMQPIVGKIKLPPETKLQPASLRGLAMYGSHRGFTTRVCFPAPKTKIEITQGGLIVLKRAISPIQTEMFVTYRPDACVSDATRLPESYVAQADKGSGIQYIIHNKEPNEDQPRFADRQINFGEMRHMLSNLFNIESSNEEHFVSPIAPEFRRDAYDYIDSLFSPVNENNQSDIYMSGQNPVLPTIRSLK